jgi:hypothetical protein
MIRTAGEELYALNKTLAPRFGVELPPWESLSKDAREEWEAMAYEQESKDRATAD